MEAYEDYMRNRGMNGDGEFIFVRTNEGVERNGYDDGDNNTNYSYDTSDASS